MRYAPIPHVARGPRGIPWNPPPGRAFGSNKRMANAAKRAASFQAHRHARRSTPRPHGPRRRRHPLQPRRERQSGAGQPARPVRGQARAADPRAPGRTQPLIELRGQRARDRRGRDRGRAQRQREPRPDPRPPEAIEQYTDTINDLLDINTEIAPGGNNQRLIEAVRASVALARAKEFADHQRGLLAEVFSRHAFAKGQYGKLTSLRAVEVIYVAQFESAATPQQIDFYRRAVEDPQIRRVENMRDGESVDLAAESATPIDAYARDEIGQLGEAFSFVHQVAVQLAGREAALRRSVGDMFLNLARRSQSLVERQLELIGDLGARNLGDAMVELSELDHLAGRMRRNAENLIVLSGSEPARRWRGPVNVGDVVMAAVDEVREHGRVAVLPVQPTLVAGHAASDVVRLMAELLENALSFSAPDTKALVAGQVLPTTYLLEIEDQGIGMSGEQLADVNHRLFEPPDVDLAHAKMLGFFVVGQLAAPRHQGAAPPLPSRWRRRAGAAARQPDRAVRGPAAGRAAGGGTGQRQDGAAELGRAALRLRRGPARWSGGWPGRRPAPGG